MIYPVGCFIFLLEDTGGEEDNDRSNNDKDEEIDGGKVSRTRDNQLSGGANS